MTECAGKEGLILLVEKEVVLGQEEWVSSSTVSGQGIGRKGFLGRGTSWGKAEEVWKCSRKLES